MCGLVGVVCKYKNGFTSRQVDIFNTLLYIDALRGEDSTGVFSINNLGNVEIVKEAWTSGHTLVQKEYKELTDRAIRNGWALIGHNRKATRGTINDENAHPFWVDDKLVLVHNGTMFGDHKKHAAVEVDSHAIAHLIVEKPSLEEALGEFHAAYALIWYEVATKTLQFLRNSQRPLHYMETETEIIWASEASMLRFVMDRHDIKLKKDQEIYQLREMVLLSNVLQEDKSFIEHTRSIVPKYTSSGSTAQSGGRFQQGGVWEGYGYGEWDEVEYAYWRREREAAHPLSRKDCAYDCGSPEDFDANTGKSVSGVAENADEVAEVVVELKPPTEEDIRRVAEAQKQLETKYTVANVPTYPWTKEHSMTDFEVLKKEYDGTQIIVECMDYLECDKEHVYMVGRTKDKNKLTCVFPVRKQMADRLTDPENKRPVDKPILFKVEVDVFKWSKKKKTGVISITGKNPLLTFEGVTVQ